MHAHHPIPIAHQSTTRPPPNPPTRRSTNLTKPPRLSLQPSNSTHHPIPIAHQNTTNKVPYLTLYDEPMSSTTFALLLESCDSLSLGKQVHAHSIKAGFHGHEFVETKLLQMYGNSGSFEDACLMFETMPLRNLHSWTALLRVHVDMGFLEEAFLVFEELLYEEERVQLDFFVFPVVLKICCGLGALELGRQLHGMLLKHDFVTNVYVGNALIDMYGKCGSLDEAKKVLEGMPKKDCVSWNSIITACAANGMVYEALDLLQNMSTGDLAPNLVSWSAVIGGFSQNGYDVEAVELLSRMLGVGMTPNARTLASVLPACARLQWLSRGKELHGYIIRHEFFSNAFVVNGLVDMYRRCGDMKSAFKIFSKFSRKCAASFNTMIAGYWENGNIIRAKELFDQMEREGVERDRISWNSMISGYVDNFQLDEAWSLFQDLLKKGIPPDSFTLGSVVTGCADMASVQQGKEIHSHAIVKGLQSNSFVGGALVEMYCKCQDIVAAQMAFDEVRERDVATWNALISGYARSNQTEKIGELLQKMKGDGFEPNVYTWNGIIAGYVENKHYDSAMQLFIEMQTSNLRPDIYTVGIIIAACSKLATIQRGKQVHAYSIRAGYDSDVHIGAALVDMYAKCGGIKDCYLVYNRISNPNLVSHNAMLTAYAMHGHGEKGIALFCRMLAGKVRPDHVTFLSVLSSCVHAGSVETGHECFCLMETYNVTPTLKHYTCMVDLLSRAGKLNEAYQLIKDMPMEADSVTWSALLGGCFIRSEVALGEIAAKKLRELEPYNTGNYVMLANLYASAGRWHDLAQTRQLMKDMELQKSPGCSWIEDRDGIHVFLASDKTHKRAELREVTGADVQILHGEPVPSGASDNDVVLQPFENKWNRLSSNPQSGASRQSDNNSQPVNHKCTDPEVCKRQIAEDFEQEKPLWILTCYSHCKGSSCDIVGDISYEELRAAAYEDAKQGMSLQSIVEKERNILKSKLVEFEKLLSEPYTKPLNSSLDSQNHQSIGANANPFSRTTQNNGPLSVSSFSQLGASLNMGFERPSAPLMNTPAQSSFFGSGGTPLNTPTQSSFFGSIGNSLASNTANLSGRGISGAQSSPYSTPVELTMFPGSTSQQSSMAFNDSGSSTLFQTTSDVQLLNKFHVENVSGDVSIWLKEKWNPGEIPEEAPPDTFVR